MKKMVRRVFVCAVIALSVWTYGVFTDRAFLTEELIRFHVVANSDSPEDQSVKIRVRDAVMAAIGDDLSSITDLEEARIYLTENLEKIRMVSERTLQQLGSTCNARVSLEKESFDVRRYGDLSFPAGVYETLRIVIGSGAGQNWWCVAFPQLCTMPASEAFAEDSRESRLPGTLEKTLSQENGYEIRFWVLDALGKVQNFLRTKK